MSFTVPPVPIVAGVPTQLSSPPGVYSVAVIANLTAMALVIDTGRWVAPFTADTFPAYAAFIQVQPVNLGGTTTGHLLVTWFTPSEDDDYGHAYPLLLALSTAE